jgi:hypothetical protein
VRIRTTSSQPPRSSIPDRSTTRIFSDLLPVHACLVRSAGCVGFLLLFNSLVLSFSFVLVLGYICWERSCCSSTYMNSLRFRSHPIDPARGCLVGAHCTFIWVSWVLAELLGR